jgi:hypothetical protein
MVWAALAHEVSPMVEFQNYRRNFVKETSAAPNVFGARAIYVFHVSKAFSFLFRLPCGDLSVTDSRIHKPLGYHKREANSSLEILQAGAPAHYPPAFAGNFVELSRPQFFVIPFIIHKKTEGRTAIIMAGLSGQNGTFSD